MTDTLVLTACIIALIAAFAVLVCVRTRQQRDAEIMERIRRITPSNRELCEMARRNPPPQSWYDETFDEIIGDPKPPSGIHTL